MMGSGVSWERLWARRCVGGHAGAVGIWRLKMRDQVVENPWHSGAAALLLSWGCGGMKESPPDSGRPCGLHDGRRFPVGAVFSDGCGCCNCGVSGAVCYGGNVCTRFVDGGFLSVMSMPPCQSDDGCSETHGAGAVCVFDQGCSPGQGRCANNPSVTCSTSTYTSDIAHEYCGCDGQTFYVGVSGAKDYPDRPFAHLGACP